MSTEMMNAILAAKVQIMEDRPEIEWEAIKARLLAARFAFNGDAYAMLNEYGAALLDWAMQVGATNRGRISVTEFMAYANQYLPAVNAKVNEAFPEMAGPGYVITTTMVDRGDGAVSLNLETRQLQ